MSEWVENRKNESLKIPARQISPEYGERQLALPANPKVFPSEKSENTVSFDDGLFYVLDYSLSNIDGCGKFVLKPQKIEPPVKDEIRDLFQAMKDIARANRSFSFGYRHFYDKQAQQENARIFYKQALLMKDFTDNFEEKFPFKEYFPYYQLMSYEQLRTYFTWRTAVRQGNVAATSLSYAFLYLYELVNNIAVTDPQDGLEKMMAFWTAYRAFDGTLDKYVLHWLKDYHIYYQMPQSFKEFAEQHQLTAHYPKMVDTEDNFDLFCAISKYDIRSSAFFTGEHQRLYTDCFYYVILKLRQVFTAKGIPFDESLFQPAKKMSVWQPFKGALFYHWRKQPDRRIILSENEIYICSQNHWGFNTVITTESGKQLIGYIMKQIESVLRTATKYKHKLTAKISAVNHAVLGQLNAEGLSLEKLITAAVLEFYKEATKTVVTVDHTMLSRIRQEALATQQKLVVEEDPALPFVPLTVTTPQNLSLTTPCDRPLLPKPADVASAPANAWEGLRNALNATELQALRVLSADRPGESDFKQFADNNSVMQEVLADSINEKAADFIGDSLLDENFALYDDYSEKVREMAG